MGYDSSISLIDNSLPRTASSGPMSTMAALALLSQKATHRWPGYYRV